MKSWNRFAKACSPRRHWYETFTLPGRIVLCAILFSSSSLFVDSPLFQLLVSLLLVVSVAGGLLRPNLSIAVRAPFYATCGEDCLLPVWVRNNSKQRARDLSVDRSQLPSGWNPVYTQETCPVGDLRHGQGKTAKFVMRPIRRGLLPWPRVRVVTTFPFNLFRFWQRAVTPSDLLVGPSFRPLRTFQLPAQANQHGGVRQEESLVAGAMQEYSGSREYQPGMAVRRWDYASWARLGKPIVREFTQQNKPACALLVDMCSTFAHPSDEVREASLSLAAAIGDALQANDYPLAWIAIGQQVHSLAEEPRAQQQIAVLMECLALAEPCRQDGMQQMAERVKQMPCDADVAYVIVTTWDPPRVEFRRVLEASGYQVRTILVIDDDYQMHSMPQETSDVLLVSAECINAGAVDLT